ncbi:MAG: hypothetical protein PHV34_16775 [Verrucomicrobiae bacterium]|nr:hypothetical protein [Verrucomicrobiae bacterium]
MPVLEIGGQKVNLRNNLAFAENPSAETETAFSPPCLDPRLLEDIGWHSGDWIRKKTAALRPKRLKRAARKTAKKLASGAKRLSKTGTKILRKSSKTLGKNAARALKGLSKNGGKKFSRTAGHLTKSLVGAKGLAHAKTLAKNGGILIAAATAGYEAFQGGRENLRNAPGVNQQMAQNMDRSALDTLSKGETNRGLLQAAGGTLLKFGASAGDQLDRDCQRFSQEWQSSGVLGKTGAALETLAVPFRAFGAGVSGAAADLGEKSVTVPAAMQNASVRQWASQTCQKLHSTPESPPQSTIENPRDTSLAINKLTKHQAQHNLP